MKNDSRKTAAHANQETPPDDVPTVSSVIGDGENAHRIVRVGALEFVAAVGDDEPRMRDADFAERLGHARIRKIRETIARWEAEIGPILSRPAVGRGLFRGKTQESVTVREYLLTEAQALFILPCVHVDGMPAMASAVSSAAVAGAHAPAMVLASKGSVRARHAPRSAVLTLCPMSSRVFLLVVFMVLLSLVVRGCRVWTA